VAVLPAATTVSPVTEPDRYACCAGQPDGAGAAGAAVLDERGAAVRAERDHLGVAAVPGSSPVPVPVRGVGLDLEAGGLGGVGGGDRVGSAGTGAVYQQDALGVPVQDRGQGLLDGGHVVPGAAAGHQEWPQWLRGQGRRRRFLLRRNFAERILDGGGAATHIQRAIPGS
jgi:hypothetical protein